MHRDIPDEEEKNYTIYYWILGFVLILLLVVFIVLRIKKLPEKKDVSEQILKGAKELK